MCQNALLMKTLVKVLQFSLLGFFIASLSPGAGAPELEKEMKNIGKNAKALKSTVGDPSKKTESLAAIGQMLKSAEKAKTLTPEKAAKIPEAQRPQFNADFKKHIDELIAQFKKIELDLTDGKMEIAKADFDKISELKRAGHEAFAAKD